VDVGVVGEKAFLGCVVEVGTMVDASLVAGRTSEDLWTPGVT
jgi:hypothetical protein